MGIYNGLRNILTRLTTPQVNASTVRFSDVAQAWGMRQQPDKARLVELYTGWAAIVADRNATACAAVPLRVYRKLTGDSGARKLSRKQVKSLCRRGGETIRKAITEDEELEEVMVDSPLLDLIQHPNPMMSMGDIVAYIEISRAFNGNGYTAKTRPSPGAKFVTELWVMDPTFTKIVVDKTRLVGHYIYGRDSASEQRFSPADVMHLRRLTPLDPYHGTADFQKVMIQCGLSQEYAKFAQEFLRNGAAASGVLSVENASQAQVNEAVKAFRNDAAGTSRAGRILGIGGKATFTAATGGGKESSYLQSDEAAMKMISNAGDMPVSMLLMESAALANAHEAKPAWQAQAIKPRINRIEDMLNWSLVPDYREIEGDESLCVAFDDCIDNQQSDAADTVTIAAWSAKLIRRNDALLKLGYEHLDGPEGEEYFKPEPPSFGGGFGGSGASDGGADGPKPKPEAPADDSVVDPATEKRITLHKKVRVSTMQGRKSTESESAAADALGNVFREVGADLARLYQTNPALTPKDALELTRFAPRVLEVAGPLMEAPFISEYEQASEGGPFNMADSRAAEFLQTYRIRLSRSITDTAAAKLTEALTTTAIEGGTRLDASTRVQQAVEGLSGYDAERIAVTEGQRAAMMGRESGWQALPGDVVGKKWVLSGDPCPICIAMAEKFGGSSPLGAPLIHQGGSIDVGGTRYVMDYSDVYGPPAHPGCRCDLEPVFADEA